MKHVFFKRFPNSVFVERRSKLQNSSVLGLKTKARSLWNMKQKHDSEIFLSFITRSTFTHCDNLIPLLLLLLWSIAPSEGPSEQRKNEHVTAVDDILTNFAAKKGWRFFVATFYAGYSLIMPGACLKRGRKKLLNYLQSFLQRNKFVHSFVRW